MLGHEGQRLAQNEALSGFSEVLFHICFARNGTHSEDITFLNFFPLLEWNVFGSGFFQIPSMTNAKQST